MVFKDMNDNDAIVRPIRGRRAPDPGPISVLTGTRGDLTDLCEMAGIGEESGFPLYNSRLFTPNAGDAGRPSAVGPVLGAPCAAMILETLVSWGCRRFLFFGWCGAISEDVTVGDIVIPTTAIIDEGTSRHYNGAWERFDSGHARDNLRKVEPDPGLLKRLGDHFTAADIPFHSGPIWSTDAIYRETPRKVRFYRDAGAIAVEMEVSALFSVSRFLGVDLAAVLVVSDELSTFEWRPGFRQDTFSTARRNVCEGVVTVCQAIGSRTDPK